MTDFREKEPVGDELGAHVSTAGGVANAPGRARDIGAVTLQLFTKQPNRWNEPVIDEATAAAYAEERNRWGVTFAGAHDSYLINLSTPDPSLFARSVSAFTKELERCVALGLDFVVTHPGNATDKDTESGWARNAEGLTRALEAVSGRTRVLLEITAGTGTSVGATFEGLAAIIAQIPESQRGRVGVCFDTCHAYAAGYDLVGEYDSVWSRFEDVIGLDRLGLFHLNDSQHPLGARKDRHAMIGEGTLGTEPFARIVTDPRFAVIPKILETPKGDDGVTNDRVNLALLRSFREAGTDR